MGPAYLVRRVEQASIPSSSPKACWLSASRRCQASRQHAWSTTEFSQIRNWGQSEVILLSPASWILSVVLVRPEVVEFFPADLVGIHKLSQ